MFGNLYFIRKGVEPYHLKEFDGNCMQYTELHETHVSWFSTKVWGLGFNAQHSAMSGKNVSSPQPFPIGRVPNMSFLHRSWHFTQFVAQLFPLKIDHSSLPTPWGVRASEYDFSVQIWIFHAMPSKNMVN